MTCRASGVRRSPRRPIDERASKSRGDSQDQTQVARSRTGDLLLPVTKSALGAELRHAACRLQHHALAAGIAVGAVGQHEGLLVPADAVDAPDFVLGSPAREIVREPSSGPGGRAERHAAMEEFATIFLAGASHHGHGHGPVVHGAVAIVDAQQAAPGLAVGISGVGQHVHPRQTRPTPSPSRRCPCPPSRPHDRAPPSGSRGADTGPGKRPEVSPSGSKSGASLRALSTVSFVQPTGSSSARSHFSGAPSGTATMRASVAPAARASAATFRANLRPGWSLSGQM